jgi:hypothetical protein
VSAAPAMAPRIVKPRAGKTRHNRLEDHPDDAKDRLKERQEDPQGPGEAEEGAGD